MRIFRNSLLIFLLALLSSPQFLKAQDKGFRNEFSKFQATRERTFDVLHQRLELEFDFAAGKVMGTATLTLTPISRPITQVTLDAVDLQIDSVNLPGGVSLPFFVADEFLEIDLQRPYSPDDTFTIQITYNAIPQMGLYFVRPDKAYPKKPLHLWTQGETHESRHWFPCWDFPNDRQTTDISKTRNRHQRQQYRQSTRLSN